MDAEEEIRRRDSRVRFNTYSVEIRAAIAGLVKQVLFLSAGIQAITIGAYLNGTFPTIPPEAVSLLRSGWISLSLSIALCLVFMLVQIIGMVNVGQKFARKIEDGVTSFGILQAWMPIRIFSWIVGLSAFVSCGYGVIALSRAAMVLIDTGSG